MRELLERQQVWIYFASVILGACLASLVSGTEHLGAAINPALGFMLFVTFLQVPMADIGKGFRQVRFLSALLVSNFIAIPALAFLLSTFAVGDALLRLGVLMVLLTPCIDYVITFAHLGKADSRLLLASTPILLIAQMALLPAYLAVFLGSDAAALVSIGPFVEAFVVLIALPLLLAATVQFLTTRHSSGGALTGFLGLLPVPATAAVLLLVVAATLPVMGEASGQALAALPIYVAFAILAPLVGWVVASIFLLPAEGIRAIAFSTATRNSLVVLPLALAIPGAVPVLPAVIVTQTLVELIAELIYIRVLPHLPAPKRARQ